MYTVLGTFKTAADPGDPNATASPSALPTPDVAPVKAVGMTGPRGMAPRTNYSRVNTGAPAPTDFGKESAHQRIGDNKMPTKQANDMTMASRGLSMNELALAATSDALGKMKTASASTPAQPATVDQDAGVTTKQAHRVADVLDYMAGELATEALAKQASEGVNSNVGPGHGPAQSGVTATNLAGKPASSINPGQGTQQPVTTAPTAAARPTDHAGNALATNEHDPLLSKGHKTAGVVSAVFAALRKQASMAAVSSDASDSPVIGSGVGKAVPPETLAMGEGTHATPIDGMVGSNQSAIGATKREAKGHDKGDIKPVYDEPALSSAHDATLPQAFAHTGQAGVKISSPIAAIAAQMQKQASNPAELAAAAKRLASGGHAATLANQPKPLMTAIQRQLAAGKNTMANLKGGS